MTNTWESNNVHKKPLLLAAGAFFILSLAVSNLPGHLQLDALLAVRLDNHLDFLKIGGG